jgi:hypothetical protein
MSALRKLWATCQRFRWRVALSLGFILGAAFEKLLPETWGKAAHLTMNLAWLWLF